MSQNPVSSSPHDDTPWQSNSRELLAVKRFFKGLSHTPRALKRTFQPDTPPPSQPPFQLASFGTQTQHTPNLILAQPTLHPQDYFGTRTLLSVCQSFLEKAQQQGWLTPQTVVLFPEHIGTWLLVSGEVKYVYDCEQWESALQWLVSTRPIGYLPHLPLDPSSESMLQGLFQFKAQRMADQYHLLFSHLAKRFGVHIIAGSIVLPNPSISDNKLHIEDGELRNISVLYRPNGSPDPTFAIEHHIAPFERRFLQAFPQPHVQPNVWQTPLGQTGILIGQDHASLSSLEEWVANQSLDVILHPTFLLPSDPCERPSHLWGVSCYAASHFRGKLWDLEPGGTTDIWHDKTWKSETELQGANLVNVWCATRE